MVLNILSWNTSYQVLNPLNCTILQISNCLFVGEGSESFLMDKDTGDLKTVMHLDRENQSKYSLTAHVHDKEHIEWECSSQIELIVSDLNDNPPVR